MKLLQIATFAMASLTLAQAGAQTPAAAPAAPPAVTRATPNYPDADMPSALRKPLRDASSGPILLRYQAMQKLKKRFDAADLDGSGTLSREEARAANLNFIDKNFDHIDTLQRGSVSFDELKAYMMQRREEATSR